VRGLHNLEINVPNAVLVGETVTLECSWQLEDEEALYSVKWYRGREEFYRYIPKELPHTRVFPLPGIEVDISRSGARRVVLQQATPAMAGRFRCEVSADAPTFHTEIRSAPLEVVGIFPYKKHSLAEFISTSAKLYVPINMIGGSQTYLQQCSIALLFSIGKANKLS
ncbi:hypothetical protein SFRURICE_020408, partial [Spodoptera frugiperda]